MRWRLVRLWVPVVPLPRRFRLSTLLLLIALAAVGLAWLRDRQRLIAQLAAANYSPSWGVVEATGPPDTNGFGDDPLAWASKSRDGQVEWLELTYASKATPVAVVVHENHCPGALMRVTALGPLGDETTLWEGEDPVAVGAPGGVARAPVAPEAPIDRIRIYLDSPSVPGWNEVDAVGLELGDGRIEWAVSATASSCYGPSQPNSRASIADAYRWYWRVGFQR